MLPNRTPTVLTPAQLARDLAVVDLTDPSAAGPPHAVGLVVDRAAHALAARWPTAVRRCRGERVVAVSDNYDALGFDRADVTRDTRYTRYVDADRVLRTHTSALVPAALRALAADPVDDVLLVCPGVVFRRDAIDRLHSGTPHQLDLWRISRRPLGAADLDELIATLAEALVPGAEWRSAPRVHPYTEAGRQVDVRRPDGGWVEVWECGLAHPAVLARAGLDDGWSGLALGMGLDRIVMLAKGVPDIRLLRSTDPRVSPQMADLEPYRPVSAMPAVRRDLSIAIAADDLDEDLGDRVRDALGADAALVEEVVVLTRTPCADLPPAALARLGARPDQANALVRVVLRDLDRTLTDADANLLRDRVYAALHRGTAHTWAAR